MQAVTTTDRGGGYRSPSGDRSFYPTSVFKRVETREAASERASSGADSSSSPAPSTSRVTPLLHRYRVSTMKAAPHRASTRSGSAPASEEPRTAPRVLTRSAQPALLRRRSTSTSGPLTFRDEDSPSVGSGASPPIMPRSREAQRKPRGAETHLQQVTHYDKEGAMPHRCPTPTRDESRAPCATAHRQPLACENAQCLHSRESIVEFIQMQRDLRRCYDLIDKHEGESANLREALADERLAREQAEASALADRDAFAEVQRGESAQLEARLASQWESRLDAAVKEKVDTALVASQREAEIERLQRTLTRYEERRAEAQAAQQEVIQNLQQTVREYDAEVVRLEDKVAHLEAQLSASTQSRSQLSERVRELEEANRALRVVPRDVSPTNHLSPCDPSDAEHTAGPATTFTTPSKRFGRFRVLTPDASPTAMRTPSPSLTGVNTQEDPTPSPAAAPAYVRHGGQRHPAPASEETAHLPPRSGGVSESRLDDAWRRAAEEAEGRCKELLRALLDKESQIAKMGAERTHFKRLYEQSQRRND